MKACEGARPKLLEQAMPGSTFVVSVEAFGEPPMVIVGTANPKLTARQRSHFQAAFSSLALFHSGPSTSPTKGE